MDHKEELEELVERPFPHLTLKEVGCKCSRHTPGDFSWSQYDPELFKLFEAGRAEINKHLKPGQKEIGISVLSCARCWDHHKEECEKSKLPVTVNSPHIWKPGALLVQGMDICCSGMDLAALYLIFERLNPWGLGRYSDHIHIDNKPRARRSRWIASGGKYLYLS